MTPQPYPYQLDVIRRLATPLVDGVNANMYAALEQGLGKTLIALRAAREARATRVLVLCPLIARAVWHAEAMRWLPPGTVRVLRPHNPSDAVPVVSSPRFMTLMVVDYARISREPKAWAEVLRRFSPDTVILDEAHALKNSTSIRTKTVYGPRCDGKDGAIIEHADRVWALSGTPCPNNTSELWTWLRACSPNLILHRDKPRPLSEWEFRDRFATFSVSRFGAKVNGSRNTQSLREMIRPGFIRLLKKDVLPDLPPVRFVTTPIDLPEGATLDPVWSNASRYANLTDDELLVQLNKDQAHLSGARRILGMTKIPSIVEWIKAWFDAEPADAKLILFGLHIDVLHALRTALALYNPVLVDGSTHPDKRASAAHTFQTDSRCRLFVGQIQAAGEVITLTAASTVAICEAEFVPARIDQAAARAHRIGQTQSVLVHLLSVPDTLDTRIDLVAARKAAQLAELFQEEPAHA